MKTCFLIKYCVFENVQNAYESNSPHLRALAVLALDSYTNEQVVAILYCVSRLTRRALINFIDRIWIFNFIHLICYMC